MKVLVLTIVSLLIAFATAQNTCQIFSCGSIDQTTDVDKCILKKGNDTNEYNAQTCTKANMFCEAWKWVDPGQAQPEAKCTEDAFIKTFPIVFNETTESTGVDHDYCKTTSNCYTSKENNATCEKNLCTAATNEGATCKNDKDCPMDFKCDKTCIKLNDVGGECTADSDCIYGTVCVNKNGTDGLKCTESYSFDNGVNYTTIGSIYENAGNQTVPSKVCKSRFQLNVEGDILQCRAANRNKKQGLGGRTTDEGGQKCNITTYTNLTDYTQEVPDTSDSYCGFNRDNKAYCKMQPGDDRVKKAFDKYYEKVKKFKCHRSSAGNVNSICKDELDIQSDNIAFDHYKFSAAIGDGQKAANIANNDKCVAETITSNVWQGYAPDSALAYGAFGVCVSLLASILF